jgi:cyclic pyranopterin phosphate synthase
MKVTATCISEQKGVKKRPVPSVTLVKDHGILGDAHAGNWNRQVSLLPNESVDTLRAVMPDLKAGDFAENILTEGISLKELPIGTVLEIGTAVLQITQIGKQCHNDCEIKRLTGRCVMPTDGVFAVVLSDGEVKAGDTITIRGNHHEAD